MQLHVYVRETGVADFDRNLRAVVQADTRVKPHTQQSIENLQIF